jgi:hypothetical protein
MSVCKTMPQIIENMGYQSSMAQVLTISPYTIGVIATKSSAWTADRYTWRMPFAVGADVCMIVAHAILYVLGPAQKDHILGTLLLRSGFENRADSYESTASCFALCLACVGFYPIPPAVNAWLISNMAP